MAKPTVKETLASLLRQGAKDLHNAIVPAFPTYAHGVDEPGQPLSPTARKPSFEESLAAQAPSAAAMGREQDKGLEL